MNKSMIKNIILSVLAVIMLTAFFTVTKESRSYIGKNYFDSISFNNELSNFETSIVPLVFAVPDKEEVKKRIAVSKEEIEEYRYGEGNLDYQIQSIIDQYGEITDQTSTIERDKKIEEAKKNFQDDAYVEEKIKLEKEEKVDAYFNSIELAKNDFLNENDDFVYDFTNVETGEHFTNGDITSKLAFKKEYSSQYGYLKERVKYENTENYWDISDLIGNDFAKFEGTLGITKASILSGSRASEYEYFIYEQRVFYGVLIAGIIATAAFIWMWRKDKGHFQTEKGKHTYLNLPIDVQLALLFISIIIAISSVDQLRSVIFHYGGYDLPIFTFILAVVFIGISIYLWKWLYPSLGSVNWKKSLLYSWWKNTRGLFLKQTIGIQILIMLVVIFFWGLGTMLMMFNPAVIVIWVPATLLIGIPVLMILLTRMSYLNRLFVKTEEMAKGIIGQEVVVKGKSPVAEHAANLNELRELVKSSHSEQVKSERLKTELITNVSHDLRTPLTSIITYTDLLKNPSITEEERISYIAILDKKSMRLKTLIEDLFEVSKMSSGNMELDKRKVDLTQLLQQAIAEHQEEIDKSGLEYRVAIGTQPIMSYVDGQKWWRVLDNLIINTLKYALPSTRVYINLDQKDGEAVFVIKNIAKYELGNDVNELTERFKRGDTSRNTEGSGLGLAIAQSIVDLHGGSLQMEVDGDLFKVTVKIATVS